jgi:cytochrome c
MRYVVLTLVILTLVLAIAGSGCTTTQHSAGTPTATATPSPTAIPTSTATGTPAGNLSADERQVFGFVTEAVAYGREHGRQNSLAEFNDPNGSFVRGDLYIFAGDYNGTSLASIALPQRVNTSFYDEVDVTGQYYMRNKINLSRNGGGFIVIHFPNPAHNLTVEPKLCYVHDVDGTYWIGAGIYNQSN